MKNQSSPTSPSSTVGTGIDSTNDKTPLADLPALALIFVQVALIALVLWEFRLESSAFRRTVYFAVGGFLVNHLLPRPHRLAFFVLFSLANTFLVLGGSSSHTVADATLALPRTAVLLLMGMTMIAICLLRLGFWTRAALLLAVGLVAAVFRAGFWPSGRVAIVWPILAGMFMFRVMIYLYDVATSPRAPAKYQALAYFFPFPNACALLFPVIDFRTFCNKYYDEDALVIYQRGVRWMTRGLLQLLFYRLVDRQLGLGIDGITDGTDLIHFVLSNSFLYLKVSGTFHLFIGMLLLFGFNLPEANHRYFLASSFTDYWRRVNTYWRGFIMKVFYYPTFFRLKSLGQLPALVIATLWCFAVTWALHLYQTWWLTGSAALKAPDILFWSILALLVLANSVWELKRGRQRTLATSRFSRRDALGLAARTAGTFAIISLLWSLWSAPSLGQWVFIWSLADIHTLAWGGAALACIALAAVLFETPSLSGAKSGLSAGARPAPARSRFWPEWFVSSGSLVTLGLLGLALGRGSMPRLDSLRSALLEPDLLVTMPTLPRHGRGYYEGLTEINWANQQLWETFRRNEFPFNPLRQVRDYRWNELIPSARGKYTGVEFETNRWGMRDQDYEQRKPPGTLRLAFLGSSNVEGYGVTAGNVFEAQIEARLAQEQGPAGRIQLLNFAIGGCSPLGQITVVQKTVAKFEPDVVVLLTHLKDLEWMTRDARGGARENLPDNYDFIRQILSQAGVNNDLPEAMALNRLKPYEPQMLSFAYEQIVQRCRAINALPVCAFIPMPLELPLPQARTAEILARARAAGFIVLDFSRIFDDQDPRQLVQGDPAGHWNNKAHAIIATKLHDQLTADPRIDLLAWARRAQAGGAAETPAARP